jgi:hypothetical protein
MVEEKKSNLVWGKETLLSQCSYCTRLSPQG